MAYLTDNGNFADNMDINFGTVAGNANVVVTHMSVTVNDNASGSATGFGVKTVLYSGPLSRARTFGRGDPMIMPKGAFDINLLAGNLPDATVREAWDAWLSVKTGQIVARLGTADMTSTGLANEVTDSGYDEVRIALQTGLGAPPTT